MWNQLHPIWLMLHPVVFWRDPIPPWPVGRPTILPQQVFEIYLLVCEKTFLTPELVVCS